MDTQDVGPMMKGIVVEIKQNKSGTYDGLIEDNPGKPETYNKHKYNFFNNENLLNIGVVYKFDLISSKTCEIEAANIVPC
jgi:hypothetical protein